jgi:MarR family transcriptional regulator for hemolysin
LQEFEFETSLGYWLTVSTQAIHRALNLELAPTGITYRQSQVIGWLKLEGQQAVGELAARMTIEPPTLVGILDRMERLGWIVRDECATDRRRKLIRLNEAADPVWQQIIECCLKVRRTATSGLTSDENDQLLALLRRVHENLQAVDESPSPVSQFAEV